MTSSDPRPVVVPPGSGKELKLIGATHKLTQPQTGGAFYMFEAEFEPGSGNKLHTHRNEDEIAYVIKGVLEVNLGGQKLRIDKGGVAHLPNGVPHSLRNPFDATLRLLVMAVPGGMERFFDDLEAAMLEPGFDDATHRKISSKHGIEWLE